MGSLSPSSRPGEGSSVHLWESNCGKTIRIQQSNHLLPSLIRLAIIREFHGYYKLGSPEAGIEADFRVQDVHWALTPEKGRSRKQHWQRRSLTNLGQPGREVQREQFASEYLTSDENHWPLYAPTSLSHQMWDAPGRASFWERLCYAAEADPEGADSWRLSADWISHSWTTSPSLKEDLMMHLSVYHKDHPDGAVASSQDLQGAQVGVVDSSRSWWFA